MAKCKANQFPPVMYLKQEEDGEQPYFRAQEVYTAHANQGEVVTVGVYKLVSVSTIQTEVTITGPAK